MKNNFHVEGDVVYIELNRRDGTKLLTMIDLEDLERLRELDVKWYARWNKNNKSFYCVANVCKKNGKQTTIRLHRFILGYEGRLQVDHISHNTLDNRKAELRLVTSQENQFNRKDPKGYRWHKRDKKWEPRIQVDGKQKHLGCFDVESDAADAYLAAKEKYHKIERRD